MFISIVSVAVKVQRPDMLLTVSLDLYIVRNLLRYGMLFPKIADECRGTKHFRHYIISYHTNMLEIQNLVIYSLGHIDHNFFLFNLNATIIF